MTLIIFNKQGLLIRKFNFYHNNTKIDMAINTIIQDSLLYDMRKNMCVLLI